MISILVGLDQTILSEQTLVSLGTAFGVLAPIAVGFGWLHTKLNKIDNRLEQMEAHGQETWSFPQHEAWALRLQKDNPTINVPEPKPSRGTRRGNILEP